MQLHQCHGARDLARLKTARSPTAVNFQSAQIFHSRHVVEVDWFAKCRALRLATSPSLLARGTSRRRFVKNNVASICASIVDLQQRPVDFVFDPSTRPTSDTGRRVDKPQRM